MNNPCNYSELTPALIGVIGTVVGTFLGWILNGLSQRGELKIFVSSWKDSFKCKNYIGCMIPSSSVNQTELYSYELVLDIYNTSRNVKIMRNIKIIFSDGKKFLKTFIPKDDATEHSGGPVISYEDIAPINVSPQTIVQIKLHNAAGKQDIGLDFIWNTKEVYLTYENDKGKTKRILLHKESYCDYFQNHIAEKENNGQA